MNVAAAVKALQAEEESFESLGENTLRGWLKEKDSRSWSPPKHGPARSPARRRA